MEQREGVFSSWRLVLACAVVGAFVAVAWQATENALRRLESRIERQESRIEALEERIGKVAGAEVRARIDMNGRVGRLEAFAWGIDPEWAEIVRLGLGASEGEALSDPVEEH